MSATEAEARNLAYMRLRAHLGKVRELAVRGNIPAARYVLDDVVSDLDEIQRLIDESAAAWARHMNLDRSTVIRVLGSEDEEN